MAGFVDLWIRRDEILEDFYDCYRNSEHSRYIEFIASVKIQSCYRGWKTRRRIKKLHSHATIIQKWYRGHVARIFYRKLVEESLYTMRMKHYHTMATLIQKIWKGYYCRKYIHNYYTYKNYLQAVNYTNRIVRDQLKIYRSQLNHRLETKRKRREEEMVEEEARQTHYMLSTTVLPGVYNSPRNTQPDEREERMRRLGPRSCENLVFLGAGKPLHLPSLVPKLQGPFRSPDEVQRQQRKQLEPTLRVDTDFYCVDKAQAALQDAEWAARVQDKEFIPFSKKEHCYEPLLHTTSKYGRPAYGTLHFRETSLTDAKARKPPFATVVQPIPLFDKLNKTY